MDPPVSGAASWHERYRERLAALRAGDVVLDALAKVAPSSTADGSWRRTYGRIELDREHYATLVLERAEPQELVLVEAFETRPEPRPGELAAARAASAGWLRIVHFDRDPRLTTLSAVTAKGAHVVRYRPYRRCTLRVRDGDGVRFAKVFPDGRGESVHAAGVALWAAHERGELPFAVPRPDAWSPRTRTVWQHAAAGEPAVPLLYGARGAELASRIGAAAGAVTRSRVPPVACYDAAEQLADSQHRRAS
jgi:hypothetical protein